MNPNSTPTPDRDAAHAASPAPLPQREVFVLDDIVSELERSLRGERGVSTGLRHAVEQLTIKSQALRLAVLMGAQREAAGCVQGLHTAARQTLELARRSGRGNRPLLQCLGAITEAATRLLSKCDPADARAAGQCNSPV